MNDAKAEEFKTVSCKECSKEFQAKVSYFYRKGVAAPIARHFDWCSPDCYKSYHRRMTAKPPRMGG